MDNNKNFKIKKLVLISLFAAISFLSIFLFKIPIGGFLDYNPKNVFITVPALIFGPYVSFYISLLSCFFEFITVSETGIIGFIMNFFAAISFSFTFSFIFFKKKNLKFLIFASIIASILSSIIMIALNILLSPLYLGISVNDVINIILPLLLPFNLFRSIMDSVLIILLYNIIYKLVKKYLY